MVDLAPKFAHVIKNNITTDVAVEYLTKDDIVLVKPGEKVPIDGIVIEGHSSVDEAMLTGESVPVEKSIGAKVFGGTINKLGSLTYKVTNTGNDTALARIIRLIQEAQ